MDELGPIIEQTYSAAVEPAAWPSVVDSLQTYFGCISAGLYNADPRNGAVSLVHLRDIDPTYVQVYVEQFLCDNPWSRVPQLQALGVIRTNRSLDEHYNDSGYYRRTAYFNEFMKPQDFVHTLGVNLGAERGILSKLYLYRSSRCRPFTDLDVERLRRLTRHLMKAVDIARRLAGERLETDRTLRLFERLNLGVMFLDEHARLLEANDVAQSLLRERDGLRCDDDQIAALCRDDAARLACSIRAALELRRRPSMEPPATVLVRRSSSKMPLRVTAAPLPSNTDNPFCAHSAAVALIVVDPKLDPATAPDMLSRRHGLTRAEARLAQALACGASLREAAALIGVRYETARGYLKSVFQKTGASRQAELVRILLEPTHRHVV